MGSDLVLQEALLHLQELLRLPKPLFVLAPLSLICKDRDSNDQRGRVSENDDYLLLLTDEARAATRWAGSHQLRVQLPILTGRQDTKSLADMLVSGFTNSLCGCASMYLSHRVWRLRGRLRAQGCWGWLEPDTDRRSRRWVGVFFKWT